MRLSILVVLAALGVASLAALAQAPPTVERTVQFDRDVRPILADKCFACHGPDPARRKARLRLDLETDAKADRGGSFAIVAGRPDSSDVIARIMAASPAERMPPASFGKPLTPGEIETLRLWIAQGAKWQQHWAWIPPKRPPVPSAAIRGWARTPIDEFILRRLEREHLSPSSEADRRTLIRRLSFDLTGLPPTAEQVDAFLRDPSPTAYETLVERLLASEHFGERMALYWLDLVRFADTAGYTNDNYRDTTPYRDYVIRSFNANKRFDRFTIEQLAGDLLPHSSVEQKIASGYNRQLATNNEGGADARECAAKYAANRVRNAATVWLGVTLGCAECHDHKYDPFTQRDFYRLAAFFADVQESVTWYQVPTPVPDPEMQAQLKQLHHALAAAKQDLLTAILELESAQLGWEEQMRMRLLGEGVGWVPVKPTSVSCEAGSPVHIQRDCSVLATRGGDTPARETYIVELPTDLKGITGIRLEALRHPSLPLGLSRTYGNFVLTGFKVKATAAGTTRRVKITDAVADYSEAGFPVDSCIYGGAGWAVDGDIKKENRVAVFTLARPIKGGPGTTLTIRLEHRSPRAHYIIGRFRLSLTTRTRPALDQETMPSAVLAALQIAPRNRSHDEAEFVRDYYGSVAPELAPWRERIAALEKQREEILSSARTSLVSKSIKPRPVRVLPRGDWHDESGELVSPNVPAVLPPLEVEGKPATRLDLAHWLLAEENPLVARVFVNRLWKLMFGQGLVRSLDDFGVYGDRPTHPELLDWLAVEFRDSGWDVKHMLRLIVTSATYRQSSRCSPELMELDPYNRLLARQGCFRLEAEFIRDNALAVSGLLSHKLGGASVKPYQPEGYWDYINFPPRVYVLDHGEDQYRRGLYTFLQRNYIHPSLQAFDAPGRLECTAERPRSNTPLQALVLLNDPTYIEAARVLAEKAILYGGVYRADRIQFLYRQVLNRSASDEEVATLEALYVQHLRQYQSNRMEATALMNVGHAPLISDVDPAERAAWTSVARVVLNLHETITRN
jgi:hypothetical protein